MRKQSAPRSARARAHKASRKPFGGRKGGVRCDHLRDDAPETLKENCAIKTAYLRLLHLTVNQ
jgi:hypothetical protein